MNQSPEFHLACACECACWMGHCLTKVSLLSCALLPYEIHLVRSILLQVYTLFCVLQCCRRDVEEDDDECRDHVEFASKNVHLITTMVSWEEKVSESIKDGKIVSLIKVVYKMLDSFLSYKGN